MRGQPEVLLRAPRARRKKVSVILLDWGVRESFHGPEYLNRQTANRDDYELIWVEFYDRKPEPIRKMAANGGIDQWIVLGYPDDTIYHKHRMYNAGLIAATGEICIICDSDAMFRPSFIDRIIRAYDETAYAVVHVDEVRNVDPKYYPFNYPTFEQVMGPGSINWFEVTTKGLYTEEDRLHRANYGACMTARRSELLRIGGSDEHIDYLGFCCGPYEMTFRLQNTGRRDRWLADEYLYHTWHPNQTSFNSDYQAPHDGRFLPLRALHARATGQVQPYQPNPFVVSQDLDGFLNDVRERPQPEWRTGPQNELDCVYQVDRDDRGFALFVYRGKWFALPVSAGMLNAIRLDRGDYPDLLTDVDEESLRRQIDALRGNDRTPRPPGRLQKLRRDLMSEPLHQLPRRMWRKVRTRLPI